MFYKLPEFGKEEIFKKKWENNEKAIELSPEEAGSSGEIEEKTVQSWPKSLDAHSSS